MAGTFGIAAADLPAKAVGDPRAAVDIAEIKANPGLPAEFIVSGLVYDVRTGRSARFGTARRRIRLGAMVADSRGGERALRSKFMLIFRGGAVARDGLSPSELQAHVEKWYRWSDELARQGRGNVGTALDNRGAVVGGRERVVTDGPYAESKDLVTGSMIFEAASLEDAIEVARACPTYEFGGSVEVRPVADPGV